MSFVVRVNLSDGRSVSGNIETLMIGSIDNPIQSIDIEHPKGVFKLFGANSYVLVKERIVSPLGSLSCLVVGEFDGVSANGYFITEQDIGHSKINLSLYEPKTLALILKPGS